MIEVADILRLHGPAYRAKFADRMRPSHLRAMQDIEQCRTAILGGQVYFCEQCQEQRYSYHSCKNRHCPKCGNEQANDWLATQQQLLLPCNYFLVTFTLPEELRPAARSNQKLIYHLLFRAASQALLKLAQDDRFVGGQIGMVGVLHTWTRALVYHPHVHFVVTGGGLSGDGTWRTARSDFLVPVKALSQIFRAKFRDELKKTDLFPQLKRQVWQKNWVVHSQPVGSGVTACKYLAPYIFRVALSNRRLVKFEDGQVTFQYKDSATERTRFCTVTPEEFIRRFPQHVLPDRFIKVRYFGLLSPHNRHLLAQARLQLETVPAKANAPSAEGQTRVGSYRLALGSEPAQPLHCHQCGNVLTLLGPLRAKARSP